MITKNTSGNNISSGFISQIQSDSPDVIARLWHNNAEVSCDIVNITVEKGSCGQTTFMVGDVIGDMLTATVKGLSVDLKGELIECHIGALVNGSYEYISLGQFRVSEVKKTRYESQITAYSRIVADTGARLDVTGLNNPTIAQIASKVAGKLNCTVTFDTGINTSYRVGAQLDGLTYYQALQVIAVCCGGYVVNTNDGNVRVHRFSTTTNLNVNTGMMVNLPELAEQPYKVETVGVLVSEATTDNNGNPVNEIFYSYNPDYIIVTKQGTNYYLKARSGQLILANLKPESADVYFSCPFMTEQMFKNNILSIRGYEYYPATIGLTLGDPRLEGCDVLNVTDVDGNTYTVPCHKVIHKYTGGFVSEITSCEASDKANSVGTSFPITQRFETQARQIGTAQATADNAYKIAGDTNQYFWFTGSGSDTGAHITETPQAQFIADPTNGGGNLLARSNGVAIRDGLEELAIFSADQLRIGRLNAQRAVINSGDMELYDSNGDKYFEVSPDGMSWGAGNNVASTQYVDNAEANASKVATNFITTDSTGIKVHNTDDSSNYTHIGSSGMDVYKGGASVASFGTTAKVGADGSSRFLMNASSLQAYNSSNQKYFEVSASGMTYGTHTVADQAYADQAEADAKTYADSVGDEAKKTAKNYMYVDGNGALNIASANPSTATRKVQISSSAVKVQNDANNHADVTSNGLEVFKSGTSVANFGASARLGSESAEHLYVGSDGLLFSTGNTTNLGAVVDSTGTIIFTPNDISVWPKSGTLGGGTIAVLGKVKSNGVLLRILKLYDYIGTSSQYALPITITDSEITANMEVIHSVLSNPSAQAGDWTVTTSNGSLTVSGSQSLQAGATYITLYLAEPSN